MADVQQAVRSALGRLFFPESTAAAELRAKNTKRKRDWQAANKEHADATHKAWYAANKERLNEASRAWYEANKERVRDRAKAWRAANRKSQGARQEAWRKRNLPKAARKQRVYIAKKPEKMMVISSRRRAKARGLEHTIGEEDIVIPTHCPVLGIQLVRGAAITAPGSPSLDRIDNSRGYVKGNVRVISHQANRLKSNATLAELKAIYEDACRLAKVDL